MKCILSVMAAICDANLATACHLFFVYQNQLIITSQGKCSVLMEISQQTLQSRTKDQPKVAGSILS